MTLYDELYFEITVSGRRAEIKKLVSFLESGEISDFFEFSREYVCYDDDFLTVSESEETSATISNDDYGIEIDEFDVDEFLEVLCRAGKALYISGQIFDISDEEYSFVSEAGSAYYLNAAAAKKFNEDADLEGEEDEDDEDED